MTAPGSEPLLPVALSKDGPDCLCHLCRIRGAGQAGIPPAGKLKGRRGGSQATGLTTSTPRARVWGQRRRDAGGGAGPTGPMEGEDNGPA
jgi:hypothetical protein